MDLQKYEIKNYFNSRYYIFENIDFVKQILKISFTFSTKKQDKHFECQYVKFRNEEEDDDDESYIISNFENNDNLYTFKVFK